MAILTVTLIFAAMCSLEPTRAWDNKEEEGVDYAVDQVAYQMRWLSYYLYVAVIYLVIGVMFLVAILRWFASYFPDKDEVHSIVAGIAFFNAIFYVTLLSVVVVLVAIRLRAAASRVAGRRMQGRTEADKRRWLLENQLSLPFTRVVQNSAALLSPLLVPLLSEVLRYLGASSGNG